MPVLDPTQPGALAQAADVLAAGQLLGLPTETVYGLAANAEDDAAVHTLIPLNLHWKNGRVKCEIALAKGKAEHDKRDTIKEREGKREAQRAMKSFSR